MSNPIANILNDLVYKQGKSIRNDDDGVLETTMSMILVASGVRPGAIVDRITPEATRYLPIINQYFGDVGLIAVGPNGTEGENKSNFITTINSEFIGKILDRERLSFSEIGRLLGYFFDDEAITNFVVHRGNRIVFVTDIVDRRNEQKIIYSQTEVGVRNRGNLDNFRMMFIERSESIQNVLDSLGLDFVVKSTEKLVE